MSPRKRGRDTGKSWPPELKPPGSGALAEPTPRHSGARAISAFTRVSDALWRASPESRAANSEYLALDSGSALRASRNDGSGRLPLQF